MARQNSSPSSHSTERLLGASPAIQHLRHQIRQLAAFDAVGNPHVPTLLLQGETGTGKGLVARIIHDSGPRAPGPCIAINCAAIPETMLEAELFGFEAGAFTDAKRGKPGLFEAAAGGTLFLDEIDALPVALQSKLLTAVEEKRVRRLGAVVSHPVDIKLIAATQVDLPAAARAGRFRADLYHRLAVVVLTIPPLRERGEDVILLAQHLLGQYAAAHRVPAKHLSAAAEAWLRRCPWPGNVRELSHLMERLTLLCPDAVLEPDALAQWSFAGAPTVADVPPRPVEADVGPENEPARMREALAQTGGNVSRAAELLGWSRKTLRYRIQRYGLDPHTTVWAPVAPQGREGPSSGRDPALRDLPPETRPPGAATLGALPAAAGTPQVRAPNLFVGRERELTLLQERFAQTLQGQRQVVFVTGEAGIGKTTLIEAFVARVPTREDWWLAYGQCLEHHGEGEPYGPVLEALDRLCRGPQGSRLLAWLRQEAPSWLVQLPGVLSAAEIATLERRTRQTTPARMQRELAVALDRLTTELPLVLVLEDLHWSDYATLDLLAVLTQRRDPARLLVLGTYRPEDIQARAHPLSPLVQRLVRMAHYAEISLTTLSEPDIAAYLSRRFSARTWPPRLIRWLHQRSGGNPLFLVTIIDYLGQQNALLAHAPGAELDRTLSALGATVPASLRQMIAAQFRRLAAEEQRALEVASIAGVEFSAATVAAGLEEPVIPVEERCEAIVQRGDFLAPRGSATWHDGTVAACYGFRHTLYQQVIYEGLPAARRHQLHRRLAVRFEQAYGEQVGEIATDLAQHWQRAGDAERAVCYRGLAAQKANRRAAPREAAEQITQALELLTTLPHTRQRLHLELRLRLTLLPALLTMKGFASPEVAQTYAQVQGLWRALGETAPLPPTLSGLWREFYWAGPLASPL